MVGIGPYNLGQEIASLPEGYLEEFRDYHYDKYQREYGINRRFSNEVFYSPTHRNLLGKECIHNVVSAVDGKIFKIMFRFITPETQEWEDFRSLLMDELRQLHGMPTNITQLDEYHFISIWDGDYCNAIIDSNMMGTSLIYTSAAPRKAPFRWIWKAFSKLG